MNVYFVRKYDERDIKKLWITHQYVQFLPCLGVPIGLVSGYHKYQDLDIIEVELPKRSDFLEATQVPKLGFFTI